MRSNGEQERHRQNDEKDTEQTKEDSKKAEEAIT